MTRHSLTAAIAIAFVAAVLRPNAQPSTQHTFRQIAPGVFSATAAPSLNGGSNSAVIVNRDDIVVVDSHMTPEAGRVLLDEIKTISDKPVRFLVNTHFHYDHTDGNQAFAPAVEIIGHEYTRARLGAPNYTTSGMLGNVLAGTSPLVSSLKDLRPTPPNVTLTEHMTLWRGDREIRLLYLGRGHTGGDVVVYLPRERVVCTGDLLVNGIANLIDGFVNVWPDALEKLRPIDFVDVIPGHGDPFKGKERIDWFQAYLRDLWKQAVALHDRGVPAAEAARQVDLTGHKSHYPTIAGAGVNPAYMARIYEVIENRAQ